MLVPDKTHKTDSEDIQIGGKRDGSVGMLKSLILVRVQATGPRRLLVGNHSQVGAGRARQEALDIVGHNHLPPHSTPPIQRHLSPSPPANITGDAPQQTGGMRAPLMQQTRMRALLNVRSSACCSGATRPQWGGAYESIGGETLLVCGDSDLHGSSDTRGPCYLYQGRQAQRMERHVVACFYMHQLRVQHIVGSQEPDGLGRVVCPSRHHHLNVGVCRSPNYYVIAQPHLLPEWQKRASGRCVAPVQHAVERNPHQPHVPTHRLRAVIFVCLGALSAPAAALTHRRQHCLRQARRQLTRTCSDATLGLASYVHVTVPMPRSAASCTAIACRNRFRALQTCGIRCVRYSSVCESPECPAHTFFWQRRFSSRGRSRAAPARGARRLLCTSRRAPKTSVRTCMPKCFWA